MKETKRIRILPDGTLRVPRELTDKLGWGSGSYLEVSVKGDTVSLRRVEVDPFAEAVKSPDANAFEQIMKRQEESAKQAAKDFETKIKDPPKIRPEDRPQFWD